MKAMTTLLSPAEVGRVYLIISIVAFLVFIDPSECIIIGIYMSGTIPSVRYYLGIYGLYILLVCIILFSSVLLFEVLGILESLTGIIVAFVISLFLASITINSTMIPSLNMFNYRVWFVFLSTGTLLLALMVSTSLVVLFKPTAEFWVVGQVIGYSIFAMFGLIVLYNRLVIAQRQEKVSKTQAVNFWHFVWPIAVAVGLGWGQTQGYRFLMESSLGLYQLGLFAAGYGISAGLISAFDSIFSTYLQPIFYKNISSGNRLEKSDAWNRYAEIYFPSLLLVGLLTGALAAELTRLLLGPEFQDSYRFVVWGAIAEIARISLSIFALVPHATKKTSLLVLPNLVGALAVISMIFILTPILGTIGVGLALSVGSILALMSMFLAVKGELILKLPTTRYCKVF